MVMEAQDSPKSNRNRGAKRGLYEFDCLLTMTGGFGRYQMILYTFVCLVSIPTGAQLLVQVFYGASPPFSCVSHIGNTTCPVGKCCSNCTKYEFKGPFTSAVSEWGLICDRRHLKAMSQAVYMTGLFVGAIVFGSISDHFGRKLAFFLSFGVSATSAVVSAVADCLSLFALFRFLAGAGTSGCMLVRFVYGVEMVVTAHRSMAGIIIMMFFSVGGCFLALCAYLIPNWRYLMLAVSLPGFLPLLAWQCLPRSPRWLIANNNLDEAYNVLMTYAVKNGVTVDSKQLKHVIQEVRKNGARKTDTKKYGVIDTLRTPKLRKRSLICFFNWSVNALVFYGINYNVRNLGGNMYLNFFILVAIDFPSVALNIYCLQRFGRRLTYSVLMATVGVACLSTLAVPDSKDNQPAVVTVVMISKFCVVSTFNSVYLYTAELFPTVIRNNALGVSSMMARIGGVIAPYVVLLADLPNLKKTFPLLVFGVMAVVAGIMAMWLPETLTGHMPQTVEQVEAWEDDYNIYCCKKPRSKAPKEDLLMDAEAVSSV